MFRPFVTNWKTSVFGGVPGLGMMIDGLATQDYFRALGGLGLLLVALFAGDAKGGGAE